MIYMRRLQFVWLVARLLLSRSELVCGFGLNLSPLAISGVDCWLPAADC